MIPCFPISWPSNWVYRCDHGFLHTFPRGALGALRPGPDPVSGVGHSLSPLSSHALAPRPGLATAPEGLLRDRAMHDVFAAAAHHGLGPEPWPSA